MGPLSKLPLEHGATVGPLSKLPLEHGATVGPLSKLPLEHGATMKSQSGNQRAHSGYVDDLEYAKALMVRSACQSLRKQICRHTYIRLIYRVHTYVCMYNNYYALYNIK